MCVSGWLRLVASTKLQVSFAKEPYKRDDSHPICAYRASLRGDARYRALLQGSFIGLFCKRDLSDARYAHMEAMHDTHIWGGYHLFYRALLQKRPERCTIRTYGAYRASPSLSSILYFCTCTYMHACVCMYVGVRKCVCVRVCLHVSISPFLLSHLTCCLFLWVYTCMGVGMCVYRCVCGCVGGCVLQQHPALSHMCVCVYVCVCVP